MTIDKAENKTTLLLAGVLGLLLSGLFSFLTLSEFYSIKILNETSEYPFGGEGPTPYYYKSADLYATVNLIWGLVFLLTLIFITRTILKKEKKKTVLTFALTLFLLLLFFIHGQIGL
jgi:hypothetical protein